MNEEDIESLLRLVKGMKDIALSGGSQLVFYLNDGRKIETEEEKKEKEEQVKVSVQSTLKKSSWIYV